MKEVKDEKEREGEGAEEGDIHQYQFTVPLWSCFVFCLLNITGPPPKNIFHREKKYKERKVF